MAYRNWIGGTYNASAYPNWTTTTNWSPNGSVGSASVGYFDVASSNSTAGQTKAPDVFINHGSSVNPALLGGIDLQATFAGDTVQLDDPGGGWRLYCNSVDTPYIYTVAAGKQLNFNADGAGTTPGNTFFDSQPTANVAAGGKLTFCTFNGTTNFGPFLKYGAGPMYLAYRAVRATGITATARSSTYVGGITINGGSVVIRASDMAAMQSLSRVNPFGTGPITFNTASAVLQIEADTTGAAVSCANSLVLTTAGAMELNGTGNVLNFTSASGASGSGLLTITGPGTTSFAGTVSCPLSLTNTTVTMGASVNVTSSTITGTGTIAMSSGSLGSSSNVNASGFTGNVTGTCSVSGSTAVGASSSFACNFQGLVPTVSGRSVTFTGISSGGIDAVTATTMILSGQFLASAKTTSFSGTNLKVSGTGRFGGSSVLQLANSAKVSLSSSASLSASQITTPTDATTIVLESEDTTTCTFGVVTSAQTSNFLDIQAFTGGTLILGSTVNVSAGRVIRLNNPATHAGTIRLNSNLGSNTAAAILYRGTLYLAGSAAKSMPTTLTINSGATIANGIAVPVALPGNLTLAAGSTFRFGAPA